MELHISCTIHMMNFFYLFVPVVKKIKKIWTIISTTLSWMLTAEFVYRFVIDCSYIKCGWWICFGLDYYELVIPYGFVNMDQNLFQVMAWYLCSAKSFIE